MSALLWTFSGCLCSMAAAPVPVILDTDIGDDIDDTWALMMMLGSPEVDLKLVVTAFADTHRKTRLVAKLFESVGRMDIPIGTGVRTKEEPIHQEKWLGEYSLDGYKGIVHEDGVQALIDAIHASPTPITLMIIGPQTNLREALKRDPSIAENAKVVSMFGSVHIGYNGKEGRQPEWNVKADIEAARAVFAAPWPITIAPLDTCGTLILKGDRYAAVAASKRPRAVAVMENYRDWANRKHYPEDQSSVLFDTEAAYLTFDESLCEIETLKLVIDDDGNTVPDDANGRPVRCALRWKDRDGFEKRLVESLTREQTPPVDGNGGV